MIRGPSGAGAGDHSLAAPGAIAALRCFVPHMIEDRLKAGQSGLWVNEHRIITAVFLKVMHLGASPCEVHELETAHAAVHAVQSAVTRHGGAILRLITDDKGTRFPIAFGLPGQQLGIVVAGPEAEALHLLLQGDTGLDGGERQVAYRACGLHLAHLPAFDHAHPAFAIAQFKLH